MWLIWIELARRRTELRLRFQVGAQLWREVDSYYNVRR